MSDKYRVLVADDEKGWRDLATLVLPANEYEVTGVGSLEEVDRILRGGKRLISL